MTRIHTPFHQFEVRFTPMLGFGQFAKDFFSPFVKLSKKIGIDNEGTTREVIKMFSEEELYLIAISWDKITLRFEGHLEVLGEKNSLVDSLFFDLVKKISTHPSFGQINSYFAFSIFIKEIESGKISSQEYFRRIYLPEKATAVLPDSNDYVLTLQRKKDKSDTNVNFGPFVGLQDFVNRKIELFHTNPLFDNAEALQEKSLMIEVRSLQLENQASFEAYRSTVKDQYRILENIK